VKRHYNDARAYRQPSYDASLDPEAVCAPGTIAVSHLLLITSKRQPTTESVGSTMNELCINSVSIAARSAAFDGDQEEW
jgi:hypothetical protein